MNGTTTAMYFATLHKEASLVLADVAHQLGQRAFVGKISMDQNSPDYYVEETQRAMMDAEDFIVSLRAKNVSRAIRKCLRHLHGHHYVISVVRDGGASHHSPLRHYLLDGIADRAGPISSEIRRQHSSRE